MTGVSVKFLRRLVNTSILLFDLLQQSADGSSNQSKANMLSLAELRDGVSKSIHKARKSAKHAAKEKVE